MINLVIQAPQTTALPAVSETRLILFSRTIGASSDSVGDLNEREDEALTSDRDLRSYPAQNTPPVKQKRNVH